MIRVLIVDDSPSMAQLMSGVIGGQPDMTVVGVAASGEEGVALAASMRPDVITMDVQMPGMGGFAAIEQILARQATPIVVVSALVDDATLAVNFRAYELGAVAVERKPSGFRDLQGEGGWRPLLSRLRAVAGSAPFVPGRPSPVRPLVSTGVRIPDVIGIGGSTGAPQVIRQIVSALPPGLLAPVMVVQHMSAGFMGGMRDWLQASTPRPICIPGNGDPLRQGHVYLAPDDYHLTAEGTAETLRVTLSDAAHEEQFRPSVNVLFASLAALAGMRVLGILLTGMGGDGARGLKAIAEAGGATWAQDEASSVVYGMPREAVRCGAAQQVLAPEDMVARLKAFDRKAAAG